MSQMLAEIERIVNEDVSNRITQYNVLFEAITNSIHANAEKIICSFNSSENLIQEDGLDIIKRKVDEITVWDNGDGFNPKNYESFCKYRTNHKKKLGCKGLGRFIFLKVYENVKYNSFLLKEQEKRSFDFNLNFDTENLIKNRSTIEDNSTEIFFSNLTSLFLNSKKNIDKRIILDLDVIRENVLLNLIPTLFFYHKKGARVQIEFLDKKTLETVNITENNIPDFSKKVFSISDRKNEKHSFTFHYQVNKAKGKLHAYYCANSRTVCEFSDKDLKITLPKGYSGFFLLESEYLDSHVNHERNNFDIYPVRTDLFYLISWEMINNSVKNVISEIVKADIPDTIEVNKKKLRDIQKERPYLVNYIEDEDIEMAGFLDKKQIIEKAKNRFDAAKENVLSNSGKESYTDKELNEAIQITQNELVSYIYDRVQVIERLKTMLKDHEKVEEVIHNLFMEKYTDDDYFYVGKNNLWLLDDRFTSYSYAASEKLIKDILSKIEEDYEDIENEKDRLDLAIFFSHNPTIQKRLKSVIIELKPFSTNNKSDRKKFQGIQQLVDYVKAFKNKEKIEEIWAFLITDIDRKLAERLKIDDYIPLFSTESPIFHRFYRELGISIYVISAKTLISDAEARNRVFLDIIKKQNKLTKLLNNN